MNCWISIIFTWPNSFFTSHGLKTTVLHKLYGVSTLYFTNCMACLHCPSQIVRHVYTVLHKLYGVSTLSFTKCTACLHCPSQSVWRVYTVLHKLYSVSTLYFTNCMACLHCTYNIYLNISQYNTMIKQLIQDINVL